MVRRTVSRIEEQNHGAVAIDILIGPVAPIAKVPAVRVGITTAEVVISSETEPAHELAADVPEVVLLLAACYAVAMAVRISVGAAFSFPHHNTIRLPVDLLLGGRRHVVEAPIEIGRAYLAGAGAVGNGFIWALATLDARGELHVVDPKNVSSGNLGRCLWFEDADVEQPKAERLAERARASLLRLRAAILDAAFGSRTRTLNSRRPSDSRSERGPRC